MIPTTQTTDSICARFGLASPDEILEWSSGEVTTDKIVDRYENYVKDGLFCEVIFGSAEFPWQCEGCGKERASRYSFWNPRCGQCGRILTNVRQRRMGHIDLAIPIIHVWFLRDTSGLLASLLNVPKRSLEQVADYESFLVLECSDSSAKVNCGDVVSGHQADELISTGSGRIRLETGAAAILERLQQLNPGELIQGLGQEIDALRSVRQARDFGAGTWDGKSDQAQPESDYAAARRERRLRACTDRLQFLKRLLRTDQRPEWMVLTRLPVIPVDHRPLTRSWVRRDDSVRTRGTAGGDHDVDARDRVRFAIGATNYLYQRVIRINNSLRKSIETNRPNLMIRRYARQLQHAVDALLDNRLARPGVLDSRSEKMNSLADRLRGKQGMFRRSMLGKFVDYSGRAVIVPGPKLELHQCGLPRRMARELFKTHTVPYLTDLIREHAPTIRHPEQVAESLLHGDSNTAQAYLQSHARWKTYQNGPTGYRIDYPTRWQIREKVVEEGVRYEFAAFSTEHAEEESAPLIRIRSQTAVTNLTNLLQSRKQELSCAKIEEACLDQLEGRACAKVSFLSHDRSGRQLKTIEYHQLADERHIVMECRAEARKFLGHEAIFTKMIASFSFHTPLKLTEQALEKTIRFGFTERRTNWRSHRDEQLGFMIGYPSGWQRLESVARGVAESRLSIHAPIGSHAAPPATVEVFVDDRVGDIWELVAERKRELSEEEAVILSDHIANVLGRQKSRIKYVVTYRAASGIQAIETIVLEETTVENGRRYVIRIHVIREAMHEFELIAREIFASFSTDLAPQTPVVLLNRQPSLHRMNVQAFEPVLVDGDAIQLHPLACESFGADFDGDTMAVHLPLSIAAQREARNLLLSTQQILSPSNGSLIYGPSQDIVMGCYWLTMATPNEQTKLKTFVSSDEVSLAHETGFVGMHDAIEFRSDRPVDWSDRTKPGQRIKTTVGRVLFNAVLPAGVPFQNREMTKRSTRQLCREIFERCGREEAVATLDRIKTLGFEMATRSGSSIGVTDLVTASSEEKQTIMDEYERDVDVLGQRFIKGEISDDERYREVFEKQAMSLEELCRAVDKKLDAEPENPLRQMLKSQARGSRVQVQHLMAMRGTMARANGSVVERDVIRSTDVEGVPMSVRVREPQVIPSNLREGMPVLEFFCSTHGTYASLATTKLMTGNWGYLARRLIYLAQDVLVTQHDCGSTRGLQKMLAGEGEGVIGRVASEPKRDELEQTVVDRDELITAEVWARLCRGPGGQTIRVRSPLTCQATRGVCRLCYGIAPSSNQLVEFGSAVGVIAAQSVSEPGTQLNLKMKHTGGSAGGAHPREILDEVSTYFEARQPRNRATLAPATGRVSLRRGSDQTSLSIQTRNGSTIRMRFDPGEPLTVKDGDVVQIGDCLTQGIPDLSELLELCEIDTVGATVTMKIQEIYRNGGARVDDKHVELIVAQMLGWGIVTDPGDSDLTVDAILEVGILRQLNRRLQRPVVWKRLVRGATRASCRSHSVLASAAFQSTGPIIEAAFFKQRDPLMGPMENVILARPIPVDPTYQHDWEYAVDELVDLPIPQLRR